MKTQLVQKRIASASNALREFNSSNPSELPLVLVPDPRALCSYALTVPTGVHNIMQKWGDDLGDSPPQEGLQCKPFFYRVAYCVTRQSATYTAPVKSVPTADNVMIDCDLTLVFMIGPDYEGVRNFVYNLGASRFNEFLAAATEEGIRQLVRTTPHHTVRELRGGAPVRDMLDELNNKFKDFGVMFTKAAITDVQLGGELTRTLQQTTEYGSKMDEADKEHDHNTQQIKHDGDRQFTEQRLRNSRFMQELEAEKDRALIERERVQIKARSALEVALTNAREGASVAVTRAEADLTVARNKVKQEREKLVADAQAKANELLVAARKAAELRAFEAEQELAAAEALAAAVCAEAEAEQSATQSLAALREHKLRMAQAEVLEKIARSSKLIISGENGDHLIRQLVQQL